MDISEQRSKTEQKSKKYKTENTKIVRKNYFIETLVWQTNRNRLVIQRKT